MFVDQYRWIWVYANKKFLKYKSKKNLKMAFISVSYKRFGFWSVFWFLQFDRMGTDLQTCETTIPSNGYNKDFCSASVITTHLINITNASL